MDITKIHILIEQGLQQVGVFAYSDFTHEEVDLEINKEMFMYIEKIFNPPVYSNSKIPQNYFEFNQEVLDRLQILLETETLEPESTTSDKAIFDLPDDYYHYIRSKSKVSSSNLSCSKILCNRIEPNKMYKVLSGTISYNEVTYTENETFIGISGQDKYTIVDTSIKVNIAELEYRTFRNRIMSSSYVFQAMENSLYKTKINSPLGEISKNKIILHLEGFEIDSLEIVYCRKPIEVSFEDNIGLEFPEDVCYDIINAVVTSLSISSEQNQQKIVNQAQLGNV